MKHHQTAVRAAGILFLIPLLAYGIGSSLIAPLSGGSHLLPSVASSRAQLMTGALLLVLNSICVTAIAVVLYPELKRYGQRTGLWYLCMRIMEALLLLVGLICLLWLLTLSTDASTGPTGPGCTDLLFRMAVEGNFRAYQLAMIILGLGSLPLCYLLFKERLVPAALSILGLLGYALLALGACLELFGYSVGVLLSVPGGLFEVIFGIRLIVKGFRLSTV